MNGICVHGSLKRQCLICELEGKNVALAKRVEELEGERKGRFPAFLPKNILEDLANNPEKIRELSKKIQGALSTREIIVVQQEKIAALIEVVDHLIDSGEALRTKPWNTMVDMGLSVYTFWLGIVDYAKKVKEM